MKRAKLILPVIAALLVGFILRGCFTSSSRQPQASNTQPQATVWTCSMHPQIRLPKPGKCPICFMDLIPLESSGSNEDSANRPEVSVSPYAAKLMEIETTEVARRYVAADVRMVGKVDYDETRVSYISAWVPGRIDRLFVDYTGIPVKKGDHLAELYSPELLTAQEELIQAIQTQANLKNSQSTLLTETAKQTIEAAREKLRLWGFTQEQVADIEKRGTPSDHMTIYSPGAGIVIHKNAQEGMYVQTGTRIFTIADISKVWVQLDAYESDLDWLRYGEPVEFTTETFPGETFKGTVSFIDPIINAATRTANVRVIVDNAAGRLKPGMFVRAVAKPRMTADGRVLDADLSGKWISPMHPEIIKDHPGNCDVCGMPLVTAESLGYVSESESQAPLVIPVSAALKTGTRAVVYVQKPDAEKPTYEGRVVDLGVRLGNYYIVKSGLQEGERVVTHGNFKLDAELQIQALPSMMSQPSEATETNALVQTAPRTMEAPDAFLAQLSAVVQAYYEVHTALGKDDAETARTAAAVMQGSLSKVQMELLKGDAHMAWMKQLNHLNGTVDTLTATHDIEEQRKVFYSLSQQLEQTLQLFPVPSPVYELHCPMAFDNQGATWLQDNEEVLNPYFGSAMSGCGEVQKTLGANHD